MLKNDKVPLHAPLSLRVAQPDSEAYPEYCNRQELSPEIYARWHRNSENRGATRGRTGRLLPTGRVCATAIACRAGEFHRGAGEFAAVDESPDFDLVDQHGIFEKGHGGHLGKLFAVIGAATASQQHAVAADFDAQ